MLWQGAKWRILKNFNVQNEECHNYDMQWRQPASGLLKECAHNLTKEKETTTN